MPGHRSHCFIFNEEISRFLSVHVISFTYYGFTYEYISQWRIGTGQETRVHICCFFYLVLHRQQRIENLKWIFLSDFNESFLRILHVYKLNECRKHENARQVARFTSSLLYLSCKPIKLVKIKSPKIENDLIAVIMFNWGELVPKHFFIKTNFFLLLKTMLITVFNLQDTSCFKRKVQE